jgi:NAD(P)-dependent dehydrogenase (short-subunit alcohol dehydrogenase family)
MDLQLQGKTAIVTGGAAGIGLAIARLLAEEGVEVAIPGRNRKKLNEAIASLPGTVRGVEADLATAEGAHRLIERVPQTDILVNNLGIYESKAFADITDEDWLRYFEVNLLGGIRLARHYFPAMLRRDWGRIIFGLNFERYNGAGNRDELPVPATYVVDGSGVVTWRFLEAAYWRRAEPKEVVEAVRRSPAGSQLARRPAADS